MDQTHVTTRADIAAGFRRLGLQPGDVLFYHSSLKSLGRVDGGADAVIDAMLDVIDPHGTLSAPAFTFSLKNKPFPVLDIRNTPSKIGILAETLRLRPGVRRSHHLTHSVCALGARAAELTREHSVTPCGLESPFAKLLRWGAKIAFIGVDLNTNTCLHAVDEELAIPEIGFREIPDARIIDESGRESPIPTKVHDRRKEYDYNYADQPLINLGITRWTLIGNSIVRLVDGARMRDWAIAQLTRDHTCLSLVGSDRLRRPRLAGEQDHMLDTISAPLRQP